LLAAVVAALWLVAAPAAADEKNAFDQKIMAELRARSPEAADVFQRANEAREKQDLPRARDLYLEVRRLVPSFDHAIRRLGMVEVELGNRDKGIALCREALATADTPENLSALAMMLAVGDAPRATDLAEADSLIPRPEREEAEGPKPEDPAEAGPGEDRPADTHPVAGTGAPETP
jgi:hypothetical protein